ncbi:MAG: hypothetical protein QOI71_1716, partial [Gaiellales bacterium]|nr:hypothetical protein [Gaiellales bacterium]
MTWGGMTIFIDNYGLTLPTHNMSRLSDWTPRSCSRDSGTRDAPGAHRKAGAPSTPTSPGSPASWQRSQPRSSKRAQLARTGGATWPRPARLDAIRSRRSGPHAQENPPGPEGLRCRRCFAIRAAERPQIAYPSQMKRVRTASRTLGGRRRRAARRGCMASVSERAGRRARWTAWCIDDRLDDSKHPWQRPSSRDGRRESAAPGGWSQASQSRSGLPGSCLV